MRRLLIRKIKLIRFKHFNLLELLRRVWQLGAWNKRGYFEWSPTFIRQKLFMKYSVPDAPWVETGTCTGETTNFLRKRFPFVYTIEPGPILYKKAVNRFKGKNVKVYNDISENSLPLLIPNLSGNINFWLDGHYSWGDTFEGPNHCPIKHELKAIEDNLSSFSEITILIDDMRCFIRKDEGYPPLNYFVDWARKNEFEWSINHDIFIMMKGRSIPR